MDRSQLLALTRKKFPFTVLGIAIVGWLLISNGIYFEDVFGTDPSPWNPLTHVANALFHADMGHYRGNVLFLVPAGILLTVLTSDEHVLGLALCTHVIGSLLYAVGGGVVVGSSGVLFAFFAGLIVRSTGDAMAEESIETLLAITLGLLAPFALVLYGLVIAIDFGQVAHMGHFVAFAFGAFYEFAFVVIGHARGEKVVFSFR